MKRRTPDPGTPANDIVKFGLLFLGCTGLFFLLFDRYQAFVTLFYVKPISDAASGLLHGIGIRSDVITDLGTGVCSLQMNQVSYRITQGCTGLFTCALYVACILAYPISAGKKLVGLVIGFPAFFVFGVLRVVIMAVVAAVRPSHIEIFHVYIMAIANLGFAMFVWIYWHSKVVEGEKHGSISG